MAARPAGAFGRIYVRPETLTLLVPVDFSGRHPAVGSISDCSRSCCRWFRSPGSIRRGSSCWDRSYWASDSIDSALRFGIFAPERRRWWKIVLAASLATALACLVNPYGHQRGALSRGTGRDDEQPDFFAERCRADFDSGLHPQRQEHERHVGPEPGRDALFPDFIRRLAWQTFRYSFTCSTMLIGGLSFLIPLGWQVRGSLRKAEAPAARCRSACSPAGGNGKAARGKKRSRAGSTKAKTTRNDVAAVREQAPAVGWRLSPFRLLLYAAFSFLSLQATRNSHQFAAVVGAVTAWNFAEWAAAIRQRREMLGQMEQSTWTLSARPVAFAALAVLLLAVGSGQYFRMTGEGRTLGLGEDALWFPHQAAKFAGKAGMPSRFLSFHNGHAALFEYYHGPERKVYIDPRLEVAGPDLFRRYTSLEHRIKKDTPGWEAELGEMGRPVILADHLYNSEIVRNAVSERPLAVRVVRRDRRGVRS